MTWSTVFHPLFATPSAAPWALRALARYADLVGIPRTATWSTYWRSVGIVVCAEWRAQDETGDNFVAQTTLKDRQRGATG